MEKESFKNKIVRAETGQIHPDESGEIGSLNTVSGADGEKAKFHTDFKESYEELEERGGSIIPTEEEHKSFIDKLTRAVKSLTSIRATDPVLEKGDLTVEVSRESMGLEKGVSQKAETSEGDNELNGGNGESVA